MAIITPQTDVYLIKCPLEINDANQLTFANATAQANYFLSLPKINVGDDFTYQRKDGVMRVPALVDDLYGYNYCMYKNEGHSNKWFFAYITGLEYLNDSVTAVSLKTDVYQTWMFDLTYKNTFVEREHVNDDTFGLHTIPEGINVGEYIYSDRYELLPYKDSWAEGDNRSNPNAKISSNNLICFQVTEVPPSFSVSEISEFLQASRGLYNKLFSGLFYFGVTSAYDARQIISDYSSKPEAIVSVFYAPVSFFDHSTKIQHTYDTAVNLYIPSDTTTATTMRANLQLTIPTKLDSYTPKNNKMFTFPYCYIDVDNNAGDNGQFRYEDFVLYSGYTVIRDPSFKMIGALGQGSSIKLVPLKYKNVGDDYSTGVVGAKFPQCAWKCDYYTNWVTQNAVNIPATAASNLMSAGIGVASAGMAGSPFGLLQLASTGSHFFNNVTDTMGKLYSANLQPDQARGAVSAVDLNISDTKYFTVKCMTIKREMAKVCDDYMSMFGYKVNEVKTPNITGRRNWNFVKTVGCYIEADIPQDDLQEIKSMFDKGITFWHNPSTFMDYSQNNDII